MDRAEGEHRGHREHHERDHEPLQVTLGVLSVKVVLQPFWTVPGRVVAADGEPLAGVTVVATPNQDGLAGGRAVTDDEGNFAVEELYGTLNEFSPMLIEVGLETSKASGHCMFLGGTHQLFICR